MKEYKTTEIVDFYGGKIGLTNAQAEVRARKLRPLGGGVFEVVNPVQFKAGETIRLGAVDKMTLGRLECLEPETPAKIDEKPKPKKDK